MTFKDVSVIWTAHVSPSQQMPPRSRPFPFWTLQDTLWPSLSFLGHSPSNHLSHMHFSSAALGFSLSLLQSSPPNSFPPLRLGTVIFSARNDLPSTLSSANSLSLTSQLRCHLLRVAPPVDPRVTAVWPPPRAGHHPALHIVLFSTCQLATPQVISLVYSFTYL